MTICLVTTGQPSTNPRLVKEADALSAAGFDVRVVGAHWAGWASAADEALMPSKRWQLDLVDWRRDRAPWLFHRSRVRHWGARRVATLGHTDDAVLTAALSRVGPELASRASSIRAGLFVAHNLGALPAALRAAEAQGVPVAFDAEDFHSGQLSRPEDAVAAALTRTAEQRWMPRCAYVTAAAPGIAEAYRDLCGIPLPPTVLNVFPLADRPPARRRLAPDGPLRLYWFSQTIGPNRGLEMAVRGLGLLPDCQVELHLRGTWQAGYEASLRSLASASRVDPARIVSHGPAPSTEMARLAATFDVGLALEPPVSVNNDILLSNKVFTYLLAGTTLVMTRTRGQARLLPDLGCAAVGCAPDDPGSFADALRPWLNDRASLDRAGDAAWRLGESRFNWDKEQAIVLDLVHRTVGLA